MPAKLRPMVSLARIQTWTLSQTRAKAKLQTAKRLLPLLGTEIPLALY
jgi:hypothetical protein